MINPLGMSFKAWADAVLLDNGDNAAFGTVIDPKNWQRWAVQFLIAPNFANRAIPDPYQFTDWQQWALKAYPMLETANA